MTYGQTLALIDKSASLSPRRKALAALVCVTAMGPIGESRRVTSWPEFERIYGGHLAGRADTHVAKRALDGGCELLVSRVVHYSDPTDASTRASAAATVTLLDRGSTASSGQSTGSETFPLRLAPSDTLVVSINGAGNQTATFTAAAAQVTGSGATFAGVTSGHQLVLVVGGVRRTVTFTTENDETEYLAQLNASVPGIVALDVAGEIRIKTDHRGSGATLVVHADSAADVLASLGLTAGSASGTGNVADIEAVTAAEFETIVEGAITGCSAGETASHHPFIRSSTTGTGSTVDVKSASTADTACGFDNSAHAGSAGTGAGTLRLEGATDGTWIEPFPVEIADDLGDPSTRFRLILRDARLRILETHDGLSMDPTDARYVVNVLREESMRLRAVDLDSAAVAPADRPAAGSFEFTGGDDGLVGLDGDDYLGDATLGTGLHAFDNARGFRLVSFAGFVDHDTFSAAADLATARVDCAVIGNVPLAVTNSTNAIAFRRRTSPYASGTAIDTPSAVLYAGWHEVLDPITRAPLWLPADGEVLAALGAAYDRLGPWLALAGENRAKLPTTVRRLRFTPSPTDIKAMLAAGVNTILAEQAGAGVSYAIEGQETLYLSSSEIPAGSDLRSLNVVLLTQHIGEAMLTVLKPDRWEPNDAILWSQMFDKADAYMQRLGAPEMRALEGYRIVCDETINTGAERTAKRTHVQVFFTAVKASEEQKIGLIVTPSGVSLTR